MGKVGTFAGFPLILAVMVFSASSRSSLSDEKVTPSPAPNDNSLAKSNISELFPPPPANKLDKRPSSNHKNNTTEQELNPSPSNPALSPKLNDKIPQNTTGHSNKKADSSVPGTEISNQSGSPRSTDGNATKMQKENCKVPLTKCTLDTLFACLQLSEDETKNYLLLIQNRGQSSLNVLMKGTPPLKTDADTITLSKGSSNKLETTPLELDLLCTKLDSLTPALQKLETVLLELDLLCWSLKQSRHTLLSTESDFPTTSEAYKPHLQLCWTAAASLLPSKSRTGTLEHQQLHIYTSQIATSLDLLKQT